MPLSFLDFVISISNIIFMTNTGSGKPNRKIMQHRNWQCPKCKNRHFETGQMAATGGGLWKFFNIQNKKFTTITCTKCNYTEMYKTESSTLENVLDFFGN